ncbi:unnamed protein product [Phytophthora fragariaefolia]|uniref:Unnamed protein product n=1 Tax=Phytophthora fragariaefolia TaxID=1490495 RepID=A0A9W6X0N3_9STRA|nr:unnamed protein product [Phytophthora fragariaefolia]
MEKAGDGAQAPAWPLRAPDLLFVDSEEEGEVQVDYDESPDEAPGSSSQSTVENRLRLLETRLLACCALPIRSPDRPAGLLALRELSEPRDPPQGEVDSTMEEPVVTNDLDEAQSRQIALEL